MAKAKIYFDMDGTIADLYGVENWVDYLDNSNPYPYQHARPLVNMQRLARRLNTLQKAGYTIGIISWLSRNGNELYNQQVTQAKLVWLKKHLASVEWNEIHIVAYGTPKETLGQGILFDDESRNRQNWGKGAYEPKDIFQVLNELE